MLQVTVLMVGKTRQKFILAGLDFYSKRLGPYLRLNLHSVREEKETGGLTPEIIKSREGARLLAQAPPRAFLVCLDPQGRQMTTEEFTAWLTQRELAAQPLVFLIGGHLGLDDATLAASQERLALSRLTMTHELARLVLLEQLYRAMTIKAGHPYHV
jgi:23S rRNA (pseudouridine1915-N3)-methyltransferase